MAKKTKTPPSRKIYDENYYKAQIMLADIWFVKKIAWLKKRFADFGCRVPPQGFRTHRQYQAWHKKYWNIHSKVSGSKEFLKKKEAIYSGRKTISVEEYTAIEKLEADFLPPMFGAVFGDILEHNKIDRDDRKFREFLELYIFRGKTEYSAPLLNVQWVKNKKTNEAELFIQILGHTTKEDIERNWDFITRDQKHLTNYIGKNKKWESYDRDIEIYTLYKKLRAGNSKNRNDVCPIDQEVYIELHKKYKSLTLMQVRSVVTKTAKRLGETTV